MPNAAGFMGSVAYQDKIYLFGGAPTITSATDKAYVYNPADESWTPLPPIPQPTCGAGVVELNGKIYVIGGGDAILGTYYKTVRVFDPVGLTWSTAADLPAARSLFATGVLNGKIYVSGGGDAVGTILKSTVVYDPVSNTWTAGSTMQQERAFVASAVLNGHLYAAGGLTDQSGYGLAAVEAFDSGNGWTAVKPMSTPRWGAAACAIGGKLFVLGGSSWDQPVSEFSSVEMFDPGVNNWQQVASMPTSRRGLTTTVVGNKVYTFGGIKGWAIVGEASNVVEKFDPDGLIAVQEKMPQQDLPYIVSVPNPVVETAQLQFYLPVGGEVGLQIYDINGRLIQDLLYAHYPAGEHRHPFSRAALPQGVYVARLLLDQTVIGNTKIVVTGGK